MARSATWLPFLSYGLLISGVHGHANPDAGCNLHGPSAPGAACDDPSLIQMHQQREWRRRSSSDPTAAEAQAAAAAAQNAANAAAAQVSKVEAEVTQLKEDLTAKVEGNANKVQQALDTLELISAKPESETDMKSAVDAYINIGGYVSGRELGLHALVERNGLLRGVSILAGVVDTQNGEVVQMKPQYDNESTLVDRVLLNPDVPSFEFTIEATSSQVMQEANQEVASIGISTFQSKSWQHSIGLGISGVGGSGSGSLGFTWGGAKSSGDVSDTSSSSTNKLTSSVQTFARTNYYYEPRAFMTLRADMFEATPDFHHAVSKLTPLQDKYAVNSLFQEYGTHICPRVLLGGWWRIEADFTSKSTTELLQASKIVSRAIADAKSSFFGSSLTGAGGGSASVSPSGGSASAKDKGDEESSGSEEKSQGTESDGTVDVHQMWWGGTSGVSPAQWRESLVKDGWNSNWRVIDRFSEDCVGIWHWVSNASLRTLICKSWIQQFCEAVEAAGGEDLAGKICNATEAEAPICSEPSAMQDFRTTKLAARYKELETSLRAKEAECLKRPGYHFNGGVCEVNVCNCGDEVGLEGSDCPVQGGQACKEEQRAECHTMTCPTDFAPDPIKRFDKCMLSTCNPNADRDRCCLSRFSANNLMLEVNTGMDCPATYIDIKFLASNGSALEIGSGDGDPETSKSKDGTLWRLTKTQNNGFQKLTTSRWILTLKAPGVPTHLCVRVYDGDWCPGYPVAFTVRNADMTIGNIIGEVVNLQYKLENEDGLVCRPLIAPATD